MEWDVTKVAVAVGTTILGAATWVHRKISTNDKQIVMLKKSLEDRDKFMVEIQKQRDDKLDVIHTNLHKRIDRVGDDVRALGKHLLEAKRK
jgi:hypothetical protein